MEFERKPIIGGVLSVPISVEEPVEASVEDIWIDPVEEAHILRKCDLCLVPLLTISFLSAYLDRSNIGNAAIAGLLPDLGMSRQQLATAVTLFYVTYVLFELPGSL